MTHSRITRYRGTSPFQDTRLHRKILFGRDVEKRSLLSLLLAEDLVVVFARSGMGKTSLINAGLLEPLRERGYFPIVARLNRPHETLREAVLDGVQRAKEAWAVDQVGGSGDDAWEFFDSVEFWTESDDLLTPVLVLDQFEELFTLREPEERAEIRRQLRDLIRGRSMPDTGLRRPRLKVLLSLREDFLANLEELSAEIPGVLRNRFRLGPLTGEGARSAIMRTAATEDDEFETEPFEFTDEALDRIVDFLSEKRIGDRTITADEVEPVLLQLICQNVESHLAATVRAGRAGMKAGTAERPVVSSEDLGPPGELRKVLEGFYDRTIEAIRPRRVGWRVRRLCESRLISSSGRRLTEDEDEIARKFKIPREQLTSLVAARLLRAEPRLGGTFYELSHDTLVAPILQSRRRRLGRRGVAASVVLAAAATAFAVFNTEPPPGPLTSPEVLAVLFDPGRSADSNAEVLSELGAVRDGDLVLEPIPGGPGDSDVTVRARTIESVQRLLVFLGYPTGENGTYGVTGDFGPGTAVGLAHFALENSLGIENEDWLRSLLARDASWLEPYLLESQTTGWSAGALTTPTPRSPSVPTPAAARSTRLPAGLLALEPDSRLAEDLFRIDGDEVSALLALTDSMIRRGRVLMGDFDEALFHLNWISGSRTLVAKEVAARYGPAAEEVGAAEGVAPDWLLAVVGSQTQGMLTPRFDDDVYRLSDALGFGGDDAPVGSAERRLRATDMTLGSVLGYTTLESSEGSAESMMFAPVERQLAHIARLLAVDPGQMEPPEVTLERVAQETGSDPGWLGSWYRGVRDARSSSVSRIVLSRNRAILVPGERVAVTATPVDSAGNELVDRQQTWTSGDPSVAAVTTQGIVRGVAVGSAVVWTEVGGVRSEDVTVVVRSSEAALLAGYKVGIYFDEVDARQRRSADEILAGLRRVGYASAELYPRPASFFVAALHPEGYEIRYESPKETRQFEYLRNLLAEATPRLNYTGVTVFNETPNFLSVFVPDLSGMVDALDASARPTRRITLQSMIDRLAGDPSAIAEALDRLEGDRETGALSELSPAGIVNVLTFLSATEADAWTPELLARAEETVRRLAQLPLGPDATTEVRNLTMHVRAIRER